MKYGYIRVSTKEQNADRQYIALQNEGINANQCYVDYESGKNFDRANYRKLNRVLKENDVLYVKAIDRLGRNYDEIIKEWSFLVNKKKIDIVVLDCPILDTRVKSNGLTGKVITDIFLQLMSYVAQIERDNIKQRQLEGIQAAKAKGIRFGRPVKNKPENFQIVYEKWCRKMISKREAARQLNVTHNTFGKWVKEKESI